MDTHTEQPLTTRFTADISFAPLVVALVEIAREVRELRQVLLTQPKVTTTGVVTAKDLRLPFDNGDGEKKKKGFSLAFTSWTSEEDVRLIAWKNKRRSNRWIAARLRRSKTAIASRCSHIRRQQDLGNMERRMKS